MRPIFVMVLVHQRRELTDSLGFRRKSQVMDSVATAYMASGRASSSQNNQPRCGRNC